MYRLLQNRRKILNSDVNERRKNEDRMRAPEDAGIRNNKIYQFVRRYARYMLLGEFVVENYLADLSDTVETIDNGFSRLLAATN